MPTFFLSPEVKVGDLLTTVSVLVAAATLSHAFFKDRALRRRELADKIRKAAAELLVASDRWVQLAYRYFQDSQAALTAADVQLVSTQEITGTRDCLWKALVALEADVSHKLLAEKLEGAYIGLYGYDPSIHDLYTHTLSALREIFMRSHVSHLEATQRAVLLMEQVEPPYQSAQLGNLLREMTSAEAEGFERAASVALDGLRRQMLRIAQATDTQVVNRSVVIREAPAPARAPQKQDERNAPAP